MKIGIIAAMEQELVLLVEQLENKVEETVLGNTYYTGRLGKHDVVLVQSGVGKVMSAMSVAVWRTTLKLRPSLILALQGQ